MEDLNRNQEYNADSIKILSDLEHIIARKGMYIGDAKDPRQLISEIIDNAIDEVQGKFSDKFEINVDTSKNTYSVRDYGRGIPHGTKELENGQEKEIIEVLCTVSNSGGKFDNNSYNYSAGLNGLGLTITNALSTHFLIKSYRDGSMVAYDSDLGVIKGSETGANGTLVEFTPDSEMFKSSVIPVSFIENRCKVSSALGFRGQLFVDGEEIDTNADIFDLITEESEDVSTYCDFDVFDITADNGERMKVALRYTSETNDRYFGYTNLLSNTIGGTHVQELSRTVWNTWCRFIKDHKNLKTDVDLRNSDYLVGLRGVCAVFISNPEFSSQTKEKLVNNKKYFTDLMEKFSDQLYNYLNDHIEIAMRLLKRFEEYRISQDKLLARKEISSIIKVNNDDPSNIRRRSVVPKLAECTSRDRSRTELFLVEGDSAAGPAKRMRDKTKQAVLPLRGKIMNVTNKSPKDAIKSQEVCNIANALGCGIGAQCDASKSRYESCIINADADPDGAQIVVLCLSVFVNMLPDFVKAGRLYIAIPPLYGWKDKEGYHYANNKEEIPKGITFTRYKGLGEMDDDEFYYCCMNPDTRTLVRVEYPSDIERFNKILGTSEGKASLLTDLGIYREV